MGSDLKLLVAGRSRFPDAFVFCNPGERGRSIIPDPVIIFEVLSDSTEHTDPIEKNDEYCATPSVQRYVKFQPAHVAATVFARAGDDPWPSNVLGGPDAVLDLPKIGEHVPLAELYADIDLMRPQPAQPAEPA